MKQRFKKFGLIMNKHFFVSKLLSIMMLCTLITSQSVFAQEMTLTTTAGKAEFKLAGSGEVTIKWGDDKSDIYYLRDNETSYTHSYSDFSPRTLTILGATVTSLNCSNSQLTSLDVSKNSMLKNLYCRENQLTSLDVSNNIELRELYCRGNQLTNLNVSNNSELKILYCGKNELKSLDVRNNKKLDSLSCWGNQLTSLDVSKNIELKELECTRNQLTNLNVNNNPELIYLYCDENKLTNLNASKNIELKELHCNNNQLTSATLNTLFGTLHKNGGEIAIYDNPGTDGCNRSIARNKGWNFIGDKGKMTITTTGNTVGVSLAGDGEVTINWGDNKTDEDFLGPNPIYFKHNYQQKGSHTITITGNVSYLGCEYSKVTSFNTSNNPNLEYLKCSGNNLNSLDISKNTKLKHLECPSNEIKSLNTSNNSKLEHLNYKANKSTKLISNNPKLKYLDCSNNQLTSLDMSKNIELEMLDCNDNLLTSLNLSNNKELWDFNCAKNKLTYPALNALFESLPVGNTGDDGSGNATKAALNRFRNNIKERQIKIYGNSGTSNCNKNIAEYKGWTVYY